MVKLNKILLNSVLIIYIIAYLLFWKLFLDLYLYLKPFALVFTLSAFFCLAIAKAKKQIPFMAFFLGSILGPIGLIIVAVAEPDIRVIEKDKEFYENIGKEIENLHFKISIYNKRFKESIWFRVFLSGFYMNAIFNRLDFLAESLKVKLKTKEFWNLFWRFNGPYDSHLLFLKDLEDDFQNIVIASKRFSPVDMVK